MLLQTLKRRNVVEYTMMCVVGATEPQPQQRRDRHTNCSQEHPQTTANSRHASSLCCKSRLSRKWLIPNLAPCTLLVQKPKLNTAIHDWSENREAFHHSLHGKQHFQPHSILTTTLPTCPIGCCDTDDIPTHTLPVALEFDCVLVLNSISTSY